MTVLSPVGIVGRGAVVIGTTPPPGWPDGVVDTPGGSGDAGVVSGTTLPPGGVDGDVTTIPGCVPVETPGGV